jgi:hypothetical protein
VDGDGLLPGRLAEGSLSLRARDTVEARALMVTLRGTEHWQFERTTSDGQHTRTETVTRREELPRVPIQALGAVALMPGEARELPVSIPVPALGPATLQATVAGVEWILEAKVDVPNGFDSSLEVPVRIHQPTALLRAGVVRVAQFALWEAASGGGGHAQGELELQPMPLCLGGPFEGELRFSLAKGVALQEVRLEIRVKVEATVSSGKDETIEVWRGQLLGPGRVEAGDRVLPIAGTLPALSLPTIQLPHGKASAVARVVFARAWARDWHIDRDIALATTTAL